MKNKHLGRLRGVVIAVNSREVSNKSSWRYELLQRAELGQLPAYTIREFDS